MVPGSLDVTWLPNVRFPYDEPPYGAKESHTVLGAGFFGQDQFIGSGATGSMCDFGAPWNYVCHDFGFVIELDPFGDGRSLVGVRQLGLGDPSSPVLRRGPGAFHVTYVAPTGPEPPSKLTPPSIH